MISIYIYIYIKYDEGKSRSVKSRRNLFQIKKSDDRCAMNHVSFVYNRVFNRKKNYERISMQFLSRRAVRTIRTTRRTRIENVDNTSVEVSRVSRILRGGRGTRKIFVGHTLSAERLPRELRRTSRISYQNPRMPSPSNPFPSSPRNDAPASSRPRR